MIGDYIMDWKTAWETIPTIVISTSVITAALAAIVNVIIALMNNRKLKIIENTKKMTEIQKYRYTNLFELIKGWHSYDSIYSGETSEQIIANRLLNAPLDDIGRFNIARPLLNPRYINELDEIANEVNLLMAELLKYETFDGKHFDGFDEAHQNYMKCGTRFEKALKIAVNEQLKELLLQDEH